MDDVCRPVGRYDKYANSDGGVNATGVREQSTKGEGFVLNVSIKPFLTHRCRGRHSIFSSKPPHAITGHRRLVRSHGYGH